MPTPIQPVILAGGEGTRLWPLSRTHYPKQFLPLAGEWSLFQDTVRRIGALAPSHPPLVVSSEAQRFLVAEQLAQTGVAAPAIVLEPEPRNTAPALALAALEAHAADPEALLLALPADHSIGNTEAFAEAIRKGIPAASEGALLTFGVVPDSPQTGYGYIRADMEAAAADVYPVAEFVEKPDAERAASFVASGAYFWNSGLFLFRADAFLSELERLQPATHQACEEAFDKAQREMDFIRPDRTAFADAPASSIDSAVMEQTTRAAMVPLAAAWSDVGSWTAVKAIASPDSEGNVLTGDVLSRNNRNCYLHSEGRLVATTGLEDLVVVETADAVLVAHQDCVQDVKHFVAELETRGRSEHRRHHQVHRPWGSYEAVAEDERFRVKRIVVRPGKELTLQMHYHRAEHWVVVQGTAHVTRGAEEFLLSEDQSTYIPLGVPHRLSNPGTIPLEVIEVQTGSYLGEDDIVRFADGSTPNGPARPI